MYYMIAVHSIKDAIQGFRLICKDTMEIIDATYNSVYKALEDNNVDIENLIIDNKNQSIEELGKRLLVYPFIKENKADINSNGVTVIDIDNQGKVTCVDSIGTTYKLTTDTLNKLNGYNLYITNNYTVRGYKYQNFVLANHRGSQ